VKGVRDVPSDLHMKKILLFSVLLVGAASVSQAGVRFGVELGLPLPVPPLPGVVISRPAPVYAPAAPVCATPAPVVYQPSICPVPQVPVYQPPVCSTPQVIIQPAPVVLPAPRAYVGFDSDDCDRPSRYHTKRERSYRDYGHKRNHFGQDRRDHYRNGYRG
jgi:hypothetical protein